MSNKNNADESRFKNRDLYCKDSFLRNVPDFMSSGLKKNENISFYSRRQKKVVITMAFVRSNPRERFDAKLFILSLIFDIVAIVL